MTVSCTFALILCAFLAQAQSTPQKAHQHGTAQINVALEGNKGELEFESPADGVLGFEHAPKTAAQKKTTADVLAKFKTQAGTLFEFPAAAACTLTPKEVEIHREGPQHSEVHAHYSISCKSAPTGQLTLSVFKAYPRLSTIAVTVLSGSQQSSAQATPTKATVKLN
jgi:hypothetical protein